MELSIDVRELEFNPIKMADECYRRDMGSLYMSLFANDGEAKMLFNVAKDLEGNPYRDSVVCEINRMSSDERKIIMSMIDFLKERIKI